MTAIANWINREPSGPLSIWTIGDTKIRDYRTDTNLSLESSKVFELQIKSKDISQGPEYQQIYFEHSIGFAFAGSSLLGLNAFATLNTIFSNLGGRNKNMYPSLSAMTKIASKVIDYYSKSICGPDVAFEAIIYGYCPINKALERYAIRYHDGEFTDVAIEGDDVYLLGDKKEEIRKEIEQELNSHAPGGLSYWRTPLRVLSRIVVSGKFESIGGGTQLNIATRFGCTPYYATGERSDADTRFRNIDIYEDIGHAVGDCTISMAGMYYKVNDDFGK